MQGGKEGLDLVDTVHQIESVLGGIAHVGHIADVERRNRAGRVDLANEPGHFPDLRRPVTRSGPMGGAEIEGHTDEPDVEPLVIRHMRSAHEGGGLGKAGRHRRINGLMAGRAHIGLRFVLPTIWSFVGSEYATSATNARRARSRALSSIRFGHPIPETC